MPNCCLKYCRNRKTSKGKEQVEYEKLHKKISFHRIPKDIQLRKLWLDRIGSAIDNVRVNSYVCSLHFDDVDFDRTSLSCVRLRKNALPMMILSTQANDSYDQSGDEETQEQPLLEMKEDSFIKDISEEPLAKQRKESPEHLEKLEKKLKEIEVPSGKEYFMATTPKRATVGTSVSPSFTENSPRKVFLKTVLKNTRVMYKQKVKALQQNMRRKNKRIAQMHSVLVALRQKNFLSAEHLNVLENLDSF
ncbi:unnamed protein product [Lasius platythorax]|uniref:THAP-type domain-containing protein n=1 Tax=Lasius platythorax TaxID=488582 RepID=A0AAV2P8R9_9HYME